MAMVAAGPNPNLEFLRTTAAVTVRHRNHKVRHGKTDLTKKVDYSVDLPMLHSLYS
jgi:hypothetical protein